MTDETTQDKYLTDAYIESYPYGIAYDNLFNAEHRDLMVNTYGFTSAQ